MRKSDRESRIGERECKLRSEREREGERERERERECVPVSMDSI